MASKTVSARLQGFLETVFQRHRQRRRKSWSDDRGAERIAIRPDQLEARALLAGVTGLSISNAMLSEGGVMTAQITATTDAAESLDGFVTLGFSGTATNGFAADGADFLASTQLIIPAGLQTGSVTVTVHDDSLFEMAIEDVRVEVIGSSANLTEIGQLETAFTIQDNDLTPPTVTMSADTNTISENLETSKVTVSLSEVVGRDVIVNFTYSGDAVTNVDYGQALQSLVIPAGMESADINIISLQDNIAEPDETIIIDIESIDGGIEDGVQQEVITIQDDEVATLTLTFDDASVNELGGPAATIGRVTRNTDPSQPMTIQLTSLDTGEVTVPMAVTIPAGGFTAAFPVAAVNDGVLDGTQTVTVTAVDTTGALPDTSADLDVTDSTRELSLDVSTTTASEADGTLVTVTVTASDPVIGNQNVDLEISGLGITSNDYVLADSLIRLDDMETTATTTFIVNDDTLVEALTESAVLTLANPSIGLAIGANGTQTIDITDNDSATVSVMDVSEQESDNGGLLVFAVQLSQGVDANVVFDVDTSDISATVADNDYATVSIDGFGFAASAVDGGLQTRTLSVSATGDSKVELDETLQLLLSNLSADGRAVTFADDRAIGTILNDDAAIITINDVSAIEGDAGLTPFRFEVSLSTEIDVPVTIDMATIAGTALPGADFVAASDTLAFAANSGGAQTLEAIIDVVGDLVVEPDEAFTLELSNLQNQGRSITVNGAIGTASILNDDIALVSVADVNVNEGDSGTVDVTFDVTLSATVSSPIQVDYAIAAGSASAADSDYVSIPAGTLSFAGTAGEVQSVTVTVNSDEKVELDETFSILLSNLRGGGPNTSISDAEGVATILNDDSASLSITDISVMEPDAGVASVLLDVVLDAEVDAAIAVQYATVDGTATLGDNDYVDSNGVVRFQPNTGGAQTLQIAVPIVGDAKVELDEQFLVNLSNQIASGRSVTIADASAVISVLNQDSAELSLLDASVAEGDSGESVLTFTASLSQEVDRDITIDYSGIGGTAAETVDFNSSVNGTLTFLANQAAGAQQQTFSVTVIGDEIVELDETIQATLSNLVLNGLNVDDVTLVDDSAIGTIVNDDTATLQISDATVLEGDTEGAVAEFTVILNGTLDRDVDLSYSTVSQTALANEDFVPVMDILGLNAGVTSQTATIQVSINADEKVELDEVFMVNLSNVGFEGLDIQITDTMGLGTIGNDDVASLQINDATIVEGDRGVQELVFDITLDKEIDQAITVEVRSDELTATVAGGDFRQLVGTEIQFEANTGGAATQQVSVQVLGDNRVELDETFEVELLNLMNGGRNIAIGDDTAIGTIQNDDSAQISVLNVIRPEEDANRDGFFFTVSMDQPVDVPIDVVATVTGNTAVIGEDFLAQEPVTLTFNPAALGAQQQQLVFVTIQNDSVVELDEDLQIELTTLQPQGRNVTLGNSTAIGTIANDDAATILIGDRTIVETESGSALTFIASLSAPVDRGLTVDIATADGTATVADGDYLANNATLSFSGAVGEQRAFTVQINGDELVELDERFSLALSNLEAGNRNIILGASATGTIQDDDVATVSVSDASVVEGDNGTAELVFNLTLSQMVDVPIGVEISTLGTSATANVDYIPVTGTVQIPGDAVNGLPVSVTVFGEDLTEADEVVLLDLLGIVTQGRNVSLLDASGVGTIVNDDNVFVSISDAVVVEGHAPDSAIIEFTVTRDNNSVPVDIDFTTVDGTAVGDQDFVVTSGTLNFPELGQTTATIAIEVTGDHAIEADEDFTVVLSSESFGVRFADAEGVGTILQDDGAISGQKWHDLNANGIHDVDEPGLNGWVIQIKNADGQVVTEGVTESVDLNGDGQIDPVTEQGLYTIPTGEGDWYVEEVIPRGWRQTSPLLGDALAFQIDQQFNLRTSGNLFENWGGRGEKWLYGSGDWYFITPAGNLFRWDGSPRTELSGTLVVALGERFHDSPELLYDAQQAGAIPVTVQSGLTTFGLDFGNVPTGSIEGRKWHDADADGRRDPEEEWLSGWTIELRDANGVVIGTAVTGDLDRNQDGVINPETETGWYSFHQVAPGDYTLTEQPQTLFTQTGGDSLFAREAFQLNQRLRFRQGPNDFLNWGGLGERWLWTRQSWHYVTPDGGIFRWNGSPNTNLSGTHVATLDSTYHADLTLLTNPVPPPVHEVTMLGQGFTNIDFGNVFAHNGLGSGEVTVSSAGTTATITGDGQDNNITLHQNSLGQLVVTAAGQTTVNGQNHVVLPGVTSVVLDLSGGDDQLSIYAVELSSLSVETGSGDDTFFVARSRFDSTEFANSSGHDVRRLTASSVDELVVTGGGAVGVEATTVQGNLSIDGGDATTRILLNNASILGDTSIDLGAGFDGLVVNRSTLSGLFDVSTGERPDVVFLDAVNFESNVDLNTGVGGDTVAVRRSTQFGGTSRAVGGADDDNLVQTNASFGTAIGFETSNDDDLDSLFETILGDFDNLNLNF